MFFVVITAMLLLFMVFISFGVFFSKPKDSSSVLTFNKPKVSINMDVFDSDQFKNLQSFPEMETQYSYKALTKKNKVKTGFISAFSVDEARAILEEEGLKVSEIKEEEIGRDNPFIPYYQSVVLPSGPGTNN